MDRCTTKAVLLVLMGLAVAFPISSANAGDVDADTCYECHDTLEGVFDNSVHGRIGEFRMSSALTGCESCHGNGTVHIESEEPADIIAYSGDLNDDASDMCLECHKTGVTMNWDLGAHAAADLSCMSCHSIHGESMLIDNVNDLCANCHQEQATKSMMPSHHPLEEGFMTCVDCHDVHGGNYQGVFAGEESRELCLSCHGQHRGPFIFEHSPVEEDCGICHDAHGTVANNLLVQNEPFLCLQCHQPHFHAGLMSYEGDYSAPGNTIDDYAGYDGLSGHSQTDSFKQVMLTKCSQCHQTVHGTDLPSQSIPGQGRALVR